jgi:hypothetical protein
MVTKRCSSFGASGKYAGGHIIKYQNHNRMYVRNRAIRSIKNAQAIWQRLINKTRLKKWAFYLHPFMIKIYSLRIINLNLIGLLEVMTEESPSLFPFQGLK